MIFTDLINVNVDVDVDESYIAFLYCLCTTDYLKQVSDNITSACCIIFTLSVFSFVSEASQLKEVFFMSLFLPGSCFERVLKGLVNNIEFLSLLSERCGNLHVSVKLTGVRITVRSKTSDFLIAYEY